MGNYPWTADAGFEASEGTVSALLDCCQAIFLSLRGLPMGRISFGINRPLIGRLACDRASGYWKNRATTSSWPRLLAKENAAADPLWRLTFTTGLRRLAWKGGDAEIRV